MYLNLYLNLQLIIISIIHFAQHYSSAWLPDTNIKFNNANKLFSISFRGNSSSSADNLDYFKLLYQDQETILLGARNRVYNLSIFDLSERKDYEIFWPSSEAHGQLCNLKGKNESDCHNYIQIFFKIDPVRLLVCGTNSFKPLCRKYVYKDGRYFVVKETGGVGICPYHPNSNSTAVYSNGHIFSATAADFAGIDSLIYREPLRTEFADLQHLNNPNFVSSMPYGNYIYFFFREMGVEYMNCGKIIYSRVARVCKNDKGGRHHPKAFTTFSKVRLNCSVPGEFPFYFDEIQSTSPIIEGIYDGVNKTKILYSALTTPDNAIGGSAICIFLMDDIEDAFHGAFKHQENINSNWLPIPEDRVPKPRPGECVNDSRVLPDFNVNFLKLHPLMDNIVQSYHGEPILIRVSLKYRFTAIAVDPQVRTVNDKTYDVIYIGTDDGKVLKVVNIATEESTKAFVISDNEVFRRGVPVSEITLATGYGRVIAVSRGETKLVAINHCKTMASCSDCIELRDPHCAWDRLKSLCVSVDAVTSFRYLIQDVEKGNSSMCEESKQRKEQRKEIIDNNNHPIIISNSINGDDDDDNDNNDLPQINAKELSLNADMNDVDQFVFTAECGGNDINNLDPLTTAGCAIIRKSEFSSGTLWGGIVFATVIGLCVGFLSGYGVSQKCYRQYPNNVPFIEQRNQLDSVNGNHNINMNKSKTVNIDLNVTTDTLPPKNDNLGSLKKLSVASDGTLQKIKKTYI